MKAPDLNIQPSKNTVSVSIIDTTSSILGVDCWKFVSPSIKGHEYLATPCFSFLIKHHDTASGQTRQLIFDLGIRKDFWNLSPFLQNRFKAGGYEISVQKSVREILEEGGVSCEGDAVEGVIWSHWHFDHTGNPSEFPSSTKLIVGPGFKQHLLPGYPSNPDSAILESDYSGRELFEADFTGGLQIGKFKAFDYFGDGSFFLLDTPGHAVGHLCGLARVTSGPDTFVFMGGDIAHHGGEWRPSTFLPLPEAISPHPFMPSSCQGCPGAMFDSICPLSKTNNQRCEPFYEPARLEKGQIHHDVDVATASIHKMQEFDGQFDDSILVLVAHDESLLDAVDFFPKTLNDFAEKGLVSKIRWKFLRDFREAVDWKGETEGQRSWAPTR